MRESFALGFNLLYGGTILVLQFLAGYLNMELPYPSII
jgi:hypothetical protein